MQVEWISDVFFFTRLSYKYFHFKSKSNNNNNNNNNNHNHNHNHKHVIVNPKNVHQRLGEDSSKVGKSCAKK